MNKRVSTPTTLQALTTSHLQPRLRPLTLARPRLPRSALERLLHPLARKSSHIIRALRIPALREALLAGIGVTRRLGRLVAIVFLSSSH